MQCTAWSKSKVRGGWSDGKVIVSSATGNPPSAIGTHMSTIAQLFDLVFHVLPFATKRDVLWTASWAVERVSVKSRKSAVILVVGDDVTLLLAVNWVAEAASMRTSPWSPCIALLPSFLCYESPHR